MLFAHACVEPEGSIGVGPALDISVFRCLVSKAARASQLIAGAMGRVWERASRACARECQKRGRDGAHARQTLC